MTQVSDHKVRQQVLQADKSFIVRAPAGSGKTGLLVQRLLVLLATVNQPEQVLAITFTRKAAAEMRNRVIDALASAADSPPDDGYQYQTWQLAKKLLAHDQDHGWNLLQQPNRLCIQTIDALAASLTRQMPWDAQLSTGFGLIEKARPYYLEAARNSLMMLGHDQPWADAVAEVLGFCQNDVTRASELLADMLGRRDQWLRQVHTSFEREKIEQCWSELVSRQLEQLTQSVPAAVIPDLLICANHAAAALQSQDKDSKIRRLADINQLPGTDVDQLPYWQAIVELLTVSSSKFAWRKPRGVTVALGFAKQDVSQKQVMKNLLQQLNDEHSFRLQLAAIAALPDAHYSDQQWQLITALSQVLKLAAAQLMLVFQRHGKLDFTELNLRAIQGLGESDSPTDLALRWDVSLQHLLIDEFQDTSKTQVELFSRLIAGWQPGDGCSLFLVGDPMQSIYRFREAEVGLFLDIWNRQRLQQWPLQPIQLQTNFRSSPKLVQWVNQAFARLDLEGFEPLINRVGFAAATATGSDDSSALNFYFGRDCDRLEEAHAIAKLVTQQQHHYPNDSIAILVRARSHLAAITPALEALDIAYQGVETRPLLSAAAVQDCLSLLRALLHPADRVAWFALLRCPWVGLTLDDLYQLVNFDSGRSVWQCINDAEQIAKLSKHGQQSLARLKPALQMAFDTVTDMAPAIWLELVWQSLNAAICYPQTEQAMVEQLLVAIEPYQHSELAARINQIGADIAQQWISGDAENTAGSVQVMTMHKAKGLEFDCIIIASLDRWTGRDDVPLLRWEEISTVEETHLLVASRSRNVNDRDQHHQYLSTLNAQRQYAESERLLYVACTRARRRLYGFACVNVDDDDQMKRADARSLLGHCWPMFEPEFDRSADFELDVDRSVVSDPSHSFLYRLAEYIPPPQPISTELQLPPAFEVPDSVDFQWAGESARQLGTLVHLCLQQIAEQGWQRWWSVKLSQRHSAWSSYYRLRGLPPEQTAQAIERTNLALQAVHDDPRAHWILQPHQDAKTEWALIDSTQSAARRLVIDRSFVDNEGLRWIIDYKTSSHQGGGLDVFLDQEQKRYQPQLQAYANALAAYQQQPIRLGLYFPLLKAWRQWDADAQRKL